MTSSSESPARGALTSGSAGNVGYQVAFNLRDYVGVMNAAAAPKAAAAAPQPAPKAESSFLA